MSANHVRLLAANPATANRPITVGIVGAGVGGLCLAAALLKQPHISVQVYESATTFPNYGAGLVFHGNAKRALELVGPEVHGVYLSRARSTSSDDEKEEATHLVISAGPRKGTEVLQFGHAKNRKTVSRHNLLNGFAELLPWERLHFGKRLTRIEETSDGEGPVKLHFGDRTTSEVDCVVGADGVNSYVRKYLLGLDNPAAYPMNHEKWFIFHRLVPIEEASAVISPEKLTAPYIQIGPEGYAINMLINRGQEVSISVASPADVGIPEQQEFDKGRFSAYDEDVKAAVKVSFAIFLAGSFPMYTLVQERPITTCAIAAGSLLMIVTQLVSRGTDPAWVLKDHDPAPYYNRRRVVMIGDAAHGGQGAAQAIEDVAVLKTLFAEVTGASQLEKAFEAFDFARRERSQRIAQSSRDFGRIYLFRHEEVGDDPQKIRQFMGPRAGYAEAIDLDEQNAKAADRFRSRV